MVTEAAVRQTWDRLRASYWFVPVIAGIFFCLLAFLFDWLDQQVPNDLLSASHFIFDASAEQSRSLMITLASGVLGTTGIVFSLLTVPLSLAASQFGSRLLRLYLRDRVIQSVLAIFVGTVVYCFTVTIVISGSETSDHVPQLTTTFGLILTLVSFASLLLLIHHIASSLQAPQLAAKASDELKDVVQALIIQPERISLNFHTLNGAEPGSEMAEAAARMSLAAQIEREGYPFFATQQGYIQDIDTKMALAVAMECDLVLRLIRKPGDFVQVGELIAVAAPFPCVNSNAAIKIGRAYRLGNMRTPTQDIEYGVNQLVEMALRALSPAINDPFTAMTCLDHLGARLTPIAAQTSYSAHIYDPKGKLRLLVDSHSMGELLDAAFNMIRHAGRENADVLLSLLHALSVIGRHSSSEVCRTELLRHVGLVEAECQASSLIAWDQQRVSDYCTKLRHDLKNPVRQEQQMPQPQPEIVLLAVAAD